MSVEKPQIELCKNIFSSVFVEILMILIGTFHVWKVVVQQAAGKLVWFHKPLSSVQRQLKASVNRNSVKA